MFKYIVFCTAILIAFCAGFFSIYGIGLLFSGALIATIIMASSLEIGKLVSVSWLFHHWKFANKLMKSYLIIAIIILMGITSIGIFGYLMAAYQKSAIEIEMTNNKILALNEQKNFELANIDNINTNIARILDLRKQQEDRLMSSTTNLTIARNPIQLQQIQNQINMQISDLNSQLESENIKLTDITDKIENINDEIFNLKIKNSEKKDIVTFQFVADEFNTDIKTVVKWFILILIVVFDPLAIILLLAFNMMLKIRSDDEYNNTLKNDFSDTSDDISKVSDIKKENSDTDIENSVHDDVKKKLNIDVDNKKSIRVIKNIATDVSNDNHLMYTCEDQIACINRNGRDGTTQGTDTQQEIHSEQDTGSSSLELANSIAESSNLQTLSDNKSNDFIQDINNDYVKSNTNNFDSIYINPTDKPNYDNKPERIMTD